jgi:hypothetical protein
MKYGGSCGEKKKKKVPTYVTTMQQFQSKTLKQDRYITIFYEKH